MDDTILPGHDDDALLRAAYEAKAQRRQPYTDEEWERVKSKSFTQATLRILRADLVRMAQEGELD